ncbi:hypothetical protein ONR75_18490 [Rhodopseudomonas sp. P2A-2r]|uniref:hypothetical protein n=1 Tax=Rhodopseudomonas sp. P2A-2r TaxID=2991972 RepID=UPI002234518F|nr:hypothetical protein [Rhodopseudomonas sp. P2A-2r]UZE46994.1 hypothetical protein ONR75_18490 [Rhodopseudomonas sp. P2A-2r]
MVASDDKLASERLRGRVEYWKQIVSIQMHFNDMCIRTRWLGLTAIATLMAAAAVSAKDNIKIHIPYDPVSPVGLSSVLMVVALMLLLALWLLDTKYYYKMLIASVEYGEEFERAVMADLHVSNSGITAYISSKMTREKASLVSASFYFLIGSVISLFLIGSFLPRG